MNAIGVFVREQLKNIDMEKATAKVPIAISICHRTFLSMVLTDKITAPKLPLGHHNLAVYYLQKQNILRKCVPIAFSVDYRPTFCGSDSHNYNPKIGVGTLPLRSFVHHCLHY